jgi:pimeloyl-ACP methyl ester carboxylesterase
MVRRRRSSDGTAAARSPLAAKQVPPKGPAALASDAPGYAAALNSGFQTIAAQVQEMHHAIALKTFDSLLRVPGLSVPTRIVQGVHDAITLGVYATVRQGGAAAMALAGRVDRGGLDPSRVQGAGERALRNVLNGAVGDAFAASGNALAVQMELRDHDGPLAAATLASLRPRACVFLHGLACDERSWQLQTGAWAQSPWEVTLPVGEPLQYGTLLEHELGVSALWLRYNTGLAIEDNAGTLVDLLDRIARGAPQVQEWVLIGHSMGGLVARRAQALAVEAGMAWARRVPVIICLGSPHQGAPLEKLGAVVAAALSISEVTRPLARLANARSRGIKDLRRGLKDAPRQAAPPALRLVFATIGDASDPSGMHSLAGQLFGDGLVRAGSAADEGAPGDVQRVELAGLGHMNLLNHPRVYAVMREWLGAAPQDPIDAGYRAA